MIVIVSVWKGEKGVCMEYWKKKKTMSNRVWVEGVLFHLCVHFWWNIFYRTVWKRSLISTHRIVVFSVRSGIDKRWEANEREKEVVVVFSIGILWKQTRRGSFRPTDKKGRVDFLNRLIRYFLLSCWVCWVQGREWGKGKRGTSISLSPLWTVLSLSYSIWFSYCTLLHVSLSSSYCLWCVVCVVIRFIKQKKNFFCCQTNFLKKKKKRYLFPPFLSLILSSPLHPSAASAPSGLYRLSSRCREENQPHHTHHLSVVWVWRWRDRFRGMLPLWLMSSVRVQWMTHTVLHHAVCPLSMWSTHPCDSLSLSPSSFLSRVWRRRGVGWKKVMNGTSSAQVNSERWIRTEMTMYFGEIFLCVV